LSVARALSGPSVITVMRAASPLSRSLRAASSACSSNGLITIAAPGSGATFFACSSTRNWLAAISGLGICLTQTTMCIVTSVPLRN